MASTSTPMLTPPPSTLTHLPRPASGKPHHWQIRGLLIDISGTLLVGPTPLPNAPHALARLRASNIPFRLCTNTSKESTASLVERLHNAGFGAREILKREIWSSIGAVGAVMKEMGVTRPYMILSPSAREECMPDDTTTIMNTNTDTDTNVVVHCAATTTNPRSTDRSDLTTPSESSSRSSISTSASTTTATTMSSTDPPPSRHHDAVIVGLAPTLFDYDHLNTAFRILIGEAHDGGEHGGADPQSMGTAAVASRRRVPLIALHKARYFASPSASAGGDSQVLSLGPGPFVSALEEAAGTKAIVVGKPSRTFFEGSLRDLFPPRDGNGATNNNNNSPSAEAEGVDNTCGDGDDDLTRNKNKHCECQWNDVAVIGDDVLADLGEGAIELGLWRVLVKTGKYRTGDECRPGVVPPDQVCESFDAFVDGLLGKGCNEER